MTGSSPNHPDIFDVRRIRRLVELMKEHELNEIDLRQEGTRVQIRRGGPAPSGAASVVPTVSIQPAAAPPVAAAPAPAAAAPAPAAAPADENTALITSPIVGTFYAASDPESPPFVKVGDHVGPETTVCLIEAMKVFNEIPAQASGKIVAVLAKNGEPVEFGCPLFKVDTRG